MSLCEWLQQRLHLLRDIHLTDGGQCNWDGITNTRNSHSWAHENRHDVGECHFIRQFSVNVWCGILGCNVIELHVIERRLTAPYYRNSVEMNYRCIKRKCLLKHEDECGYNMTELFRISAERQRKV
jgi:hypothetical protein